MIAKHTIIKIKYTDNTKKLSNRETYMPAGNLGHQESDNSKVK